MMILKKIKNIILGGLIAMLSMQAQAGLISDTNNDSFIDDSTGLEWMDFGINNGQSYNYVASQLGQGGQYQGWALATKEQVYTMWANAFLGLGASYENANYGGQGQLYSYDGQGTQGSVFNDIFDKMGSNVTYNSGTQYERNYALGWFAGTNGLSYVNYAEYIGSYYDYRYNDYLRLHDNYNYDSHLNNQHIHHSTMLVRNSVPEPMTMAIFAFALLGLVWRRQQAH